AVAVVLPGSRLTPPAGQQRLLQAVLDERRLARAAHAGDADELAERNLGIDIFQVVVPGADDLQDLARAGTALFRNDDLLRPTQVLTCETGGRAHDLVEGAGHD